MYVDFAMIYRYCVPLQAFWYCGRLMEGLCGRRASVCAISSLCCGSKGKHIERRLNENGVNCSHESQCCFLPKTIVYLSVIYRHIFWKSLHNGSGWGVSVSWILHVGCCARHLGVQSGRLRRHSRCFALYIPAHQEDLSMGNKRASCTFKRWYSWFYTGNRLHKILWRTGLYCYVLMYNPA